MERTVVLVKPDGLQRGLVGQIISRFERKGLKLVALKMVNMDEDLLDQWYTNLKEKPYFVPVKNYMKSSPVIGMLWEGFEAVEAVRKIVGITKARAAEAGSIRGDFGMSQSNNLIHASDSLDNAFREQKLMFELEEIIEYNKGDYIYVYNEEERS